MKTELFDLKNVATFIEFCFHEYLGSNNRTEISFWLLSSFSKITLNVDR